VKVLKEPECIFTPVQTPIEVSNDPQALANNYFIPDHALGFTGIGLPLENTLISFWRLHSLAFGFETFAFRQKTELSRRSTVFRGNPIPVLTKYLGL
jgi:hypothetical protein